MMNRWTENLVQERLKEAAQTLRRLPPVKVGGYFTAWPTIIHDVSDKRNWERSVIRRGPPTAQAISRMDETLTWFRWLTADENRLIWLRANKVKWRSICWRVGCSRTKAWQDWNLAIIKITRGLNKEKRQCQMDMRAPQWTSQVLLSVEQSSLDRAKITPKASNDPQKGRCEQRAL